MTRFRPCIDLYQGRVRQLVGGTFSDGSAEAPPHIRYTSHRDPAWYARLYRRDGLEGGHVIRLGPGNDDAARRALEAWPGGLHVGGGVEPENARELLEQGAGAVIVTSWILPGEDIDWQRVRELSTGIGRERLVVDLSCRKTKGGWRVAKNLWKTVTRVKLNAALFEGLAEYCFEFLVHAVDVEGTLRGIDEDLVKNLAGWSPLPVTYAGGARNLDDLRHIAEISGGRVDCTIGSALDIFGGSGVRYSDCVAFNRAS